MSYSRRRKLVHFASTAWFVASAAFLIILALRQAGATWLLIFSLSGYSAVLTFLLISLYLFALFRGVVKTPKPEHPLTTSIHYMTFYDISPLLGALAGAISTFGNNDMTEQLVTISIGSLVTTFFIWVVLDPAIGLFEMMLPTSRKHRCQRLAEAKAMREKQRVDSKRLLAELAEKERLDQQRWRKLLQPMAERLAELTLSSCETDPGQTEGQSVRMGAEAWRLGGINCMRRLHEMAIDICNKKYPNRCIIDHIAIWWDGIGTWHTPSLSKSLRKTG